MLLGDWIWVMVIYDSCNCRSRKCCHSSLVVQIQSQTQLLIRFKLLIERHRLTSECLIQPWKLSLTKARPAQKTPQPSGDLPPWREDGAGGASSSASRPPVVSVDDSNDDPPESLEDAVQKMLETAVKDDVMSLDPQVSGCFFVCFLPSKLRLAELVYPRMPNGLQWDVVCVCVSGFAFVHDLQHKGFTLASLFLFKMCLYPRAEIMDLKAIQPDVKLLFWRVYSTAGYLGRARVARLLQLGCIACIGSISDLAHLEFKFKLTSSVQVDFQVDLESFWSD